MIYCNSVTQVSSEVSGHMAISTKGSAQVSSGTKSRERSPLTVRSMKDVDLIETAHLILQRLPKGWSKVRCHGDVTALLW